MRLVPQYGGFIAVGIEWLGFVLCLSLVNINWSEPASQYGYYPETRFIFGIGFTLASLSYYLFSRRLDQYWHLTSTFSALAGIFLSITAWVPYTPNVRGFIFDIHNLTVSAMVLLYALPMICIAFRKAHHTLSLLSRLGFAALVITSGGAFMARAQGRGVLILQITSAACLQLWILAANYVALKPRPEIKNPATVVAKL